MSKITSLSSKFKIILLMSVVFCVMFSLGNLIQNSRPAEAQEDDGILTLLALPCAPQSDGPQFGFPKNASAPVTYSFDEGFNRTQRDIIDDAFKVWNNTSTCLNLKFSKLTSGGTVKVKIGNAGGKPGYMDYLKNSNNILISAIIELNLNNPNHFDFNVDGYTNAIKKVMIHEIGHLHGLGDITVSSGSCGGQTLGKSVMNALCGTNDINGAIANSPKDCDKASIAENPQCSAPTPTPTPPIIPYGCRLPCETTLEVNCEFISGCPYGYEMQDGYCCPNYSPIVIDVAGDGFDLTDAVNGVLFDIEGSPLNTLEQIAWTTSNSDDAWLALDRNGNGVIDTGKELFGNFTQQPYPPPAGQMRNGFLALAEFDKSANGGNNDGDITAQDTVFNNLRLWQDANHNGTSEAGELKTLSLLGVTKIELDYKESRRMDEHGNRFKYRAKVKDAQGNQVGRWAWDVFLLTECP